VRFAVELERAAAGPRALADDEIRARHLLRGEGLQLDRVGAGVGCSADDVARALERAEVIGG
jgi:hypothetical protein